MSMFCKGIFVDNVFIELFYFLLKFEMFYFDELIYIMIIIVE